jgi:coenzyme F420 hydrogenase subunit beta
MSAVEEFAKKNVAIVGTPCQIRSYRRMQTSFLGATKLARAVSLAIGLFCMESYRYDQLLGDYLRAKNVDLNQVGRFEIKKGKFRAYIQGVEALSVPLREVKDFARSSCKVCEDFTAEFADISVGGVGCPDGWSTVMVRTTRGQEFLAEAEKNGWLELKAIDSGKHGIEQVLRLSASKKADAQKPEAQILSPATA